MGTMLLNIRAPTVSPSPLHSPDIGNDTVEETVEMTSGGNGARFLTHHHLLLLWTAVNSWCSPKKTSKPSTVSIHFLTCTQDVDIV